MEFLVAGLRLVLVVFSLDVGVLDRVLAHIITHHGVDDDGLARLLHLRLDGVVLFVTLLHGFLHHDFAHDQVFLDGVAQLRRIGLLALGHDLLDDRFGTRRWDGLAVDDREVLREGGSGDNCDEC